MKNLYKKRPLIVTISAAVILFHLGLLVKFSRAKPPPPVYIAKRIGVNTKYLPKEVKVTRKKVAPKPKKVVTPKKKPQKKRPKQLLNQIEKSIAKIDSAKTATKKDTKLEVPQSIDLTKPFEDVAITYQELLVTALRDQLTLPGSGKVTIELTLTKKGEFEMVNVVSSESESNKSYLIEHLKEAFFPPFTKDIHEASNQTFLLTFCND